ncbi:MAG: DALR domain-containing protein, partial [Erysipelotrichaceae bacterium]
DTFNTAKTELGKIENALKQAELKAILADQKFPADYDEEKFAQFMSCMSDDLNTPNAYTVLFDTVKLLNQSLRTRDVDFSKLGLYYRAVKKMLGILGIFIDELNLSEEDRQLYSAWDNAKKEKDFAKADEYRAKLSEKGIL